MIGAVEVRPARPDELGAVGRLTVEAYAADGYFDHEDEYAQVLLDAARRAEEATLLVAVADGELAGTVTECPPGSPYRELASDGEGEFRMLAVAPHARRRGLARRLVQACIDDSRAQGHRRLVLCSEAGMSGAHRLYTSMGFVRVPELDWEPVPGVVLLGFALELGSAR